MLYIFLSRMFAPSEIGRTGFKPGVVRVDRAWKKRLLGLLAGFLERTGGGRGHYTAWRVGRKLRFDPRSGRYDGDPEADRYLTRDYRAPWVLPEV
jgi:hypothetical protein